MGAAPLPVWGRDPTLQGMGFGGTPPVQGGGSPVVKRGLMGESLSGGAWTPSSVQGWG